MRPKRCIYPEATQVRLREGTLDRIHAAAEAKRTTAQDLMRRGIEWAIAHAAREQKREQEAA